MQYFALFKLYPYAIEDQKYKQNKTGIFISEFAIYKGHNEFNDSKKQMDIKIYVKQCILGNWRLFISIVHKLSVYERYFLHLDTKRQTCQFQITIIVRQTTNGNNNMWLLFQRLPILVQPCYYVELLIRTLVILIITTSTHLFLL